VRHPILSTITKELFNFRSRAQGYLALFPELQARRARRARRPHSLNCCRCQQVQAAPCLARAGVSA
jgi:hypothetical protein